jgi:hypothetical protein
VSHETSHDSIFIDMIRLRDILRELQYGEKLWADPATAMDSDAIRAFLDRVYKGELEPNTPEEAEVFAAIKTYLLRNTRDQIDTQMLADLMAMKPRFPAILDPRKSDQRVTAVYRGMTVAIEDVPALIAKARQVKPVDIFGMAWFQLSGVDTELRSRSKGNFASFATTLRSAASFGKTASFDASGRWAVVTKTPYARIAGSALWNPDWLAMVGGFEESEIWLIGQQFPVQDLYVYHPKSVGDRAPRETELVSMALARRGIEL